MRVALLLGGGGTVGIAWETGVLAGLQDACGFRAAESTVIVGTSAGSSVGAEMALGKDPHTTIDFEREAARSGRGLAPPDLQKGPFAEIIKLLMSADERTPEWAARVGRLALEAEAVIDEDKFITGFRRTFGTDAWPDVDFRATTVNCMTGKRQVWSAAHGIELSRAVASSCAIPGFFPPISFEGQHYFDSARGENYHAQIVDGMELDAALFIGPKIAVPGVDAMIRRDMEAIAASGVRVHTILGSAKLDASGVNLMDNSQRRFAFDAGLEDGAAHAAAVAALLG